MRAIDGDALMKRLGIAYDCRECDQDKSPYCTWKPDVVDVCQIISDAPTIEERKNARWIIKETTYEDTEAKCSRCGFEMLVNQPGNGLHMVNDLRYCPHCGADMRGEQDE